MNLCKYKNIFGIPNTGVHRYKLFGISIVDTLGTIMIAYLINYYYRINMWLILIILFIIAEILHYLFCVETAVIKFLTKK